MVEAHGRVTFKLKINVEAHGRVTFKLKINVETCHITPLIINNM